MKIGHIYRVRETGDDLYDVLALDGESSDEQWAIVDASKSVSACDGPPTVYVIKVLAIVRRSAKVEQ